MFTYFPLLASCSTIQNTRTTKRVVINIKQRINNTTRWRKILTYGGDTQSRNLRKKLAQVSWAFLDETNNFLNTFRGPLHGNTEFLLE